MTVSRNDEPLLDAGVRLDSLPATGRTLEVAATEEQREAIAERLGILSVEALAAKLLARPIKGGIEVTGTLTADLTQACVLTFEPVPEHIAEKLFRLFLHGPAEAQDFAPGAEIYVDLEGEDAPDHFDGPEADFSEWLIETLSLALNPYPRKDGAEIDSAYKDEGDEADSPFAALGALKTDKD
jgi:hypothetical protein